MNAFLKRCFDILVSFCVLTAAFPLFLLVGIAIKLDSEGPVLFVQKRVGRHGELFRMYKLRTMVDNAANIGPNFTTKRDPRITRVGRALRKWKLDEIPQLINVLKGEMSIVGPRPDYVEYYRLYTPEQRRVFSLRPGMAGPALIAYRNEEEILAQSKNPEQDYVNHIMQEKLRLDLEYVGNQSLLYDLKILGQALRTVLFE